MKRFSICHNIIVILSIFSSFCISCVESVSEIEKQQSDEKTKTTDTLSVAITDDYIDGFTSILFSDGHFILIQQDSLYGYYFLFDSLDTKIGKPIEDMSICAYCDSSLKPSLVMIGDLLLNITNYTSDSFDLVLFKGDSIIERNTISYASQGGYYIQTKASTSTGGYLNAASDILSVIDAATATGDERILNNAQRIFQAETELSGLNNEYTEGIPEMIGGIFGMARGNVALGVAEYGVGYFKLLRGLAHSVIEGLMGDITPSLISAQLINPGTVSIVFDVQGVTDNTQEWPNYSVLYWKSGNYSAIHTTPERITHNGSFTKQIDGLSSGRWGFKVIVFPERFYSHPNLATYYSYDTETMYVRVAPVDIESISQVWDNTDTDPVQFQFKVTMNYLSEGDSIIMKYSDGYGICVTQDGNREYYSSSDNVGTGSNEVYLIPLNAKKSDFVVDSLNSGKMIYKGDDIIFQSYFYADGQTQYGLEHKVLPSYKFNLGCPDENHPHMIDLGLSVKWACCNVGATSPVDYGGHFAWGETETKSDGYDWLSYKHCINGYYNSLTKYCFQGMYGHYHDTDGVNYFTDSIATLEAIDDVAHVKWGGNWRIPTKTEYEELNDKLNCSWTWVTWEGVNCIKITSIKSGYRGNFILLPAAGVNQQGYGSSESAYWSSTLYTLSSIDAWAFYWKYGVMFYSNREHGYSIRPVCN